MKTIPLPPRPYSLISPDEATTPGGWSAIPGDLIGRDNELATAESFLAKVHSGACALLLEGDAGIGKTSIWRAIAQRAAGRGYRVLSCQADQTEAAMSFVGLTNLVGEAADGALAALPETQRRALAVALLRETPRAGAHPEPRTIAVAFTALLVHLARSAPLVVAIDDLQWLDPPTARLLTFALRRLNGHPVGLLATVRTPQASADDLLGLERAMAARLRHVRVGPLSADALRRIVDRRLGHSVARPTLVKIVESSGGNPLFAIEIARALAANPPSEPGAPLPVPDSLRVLLAQRIPRLSPPAREALLVTAALARPTAELVEQASSAEGLALAEESGLLRVERGRLLFGHPLYASAVYATAASARRRQVHRRLARLVVDPEEQARHLALATTDPDEHVARTLEAAAAVARARGAWESAAELLERASNLTPLDRVDDTHRRTLSAAEHYVHAGDRPRARTLLQTILAQALPGSLRVEALRLLAEISYNDEHFADAIRLYGEALTYASDPRLAATIELGLSYARSMAGDFAAGAQHAHAALAQAEASGDSGLIGAALAHCAMTDFLCGAGVNWDSVERSLALEDHARVLPLQDRPSAIAAALRFYAGRLSEARERFLALYAWSRERGDESDIAWLGSTLSWLETMHGQFDVALQFADEAELLARLTGSASVRSLALGQRAAVRAHRGEVESTRTDCAEAERLWHQTGYVVPSIWIASALGLLELSLGDAAAAWQACAPPAEAVEAHGIGEPITIFFLPVALEALIALRHLDRAEVLLDAFERRGRELDRAWALATGARCRALLLAARGDLAAAALAAEQALTEHARLEMPFELARTLHVQGQIHRRRREKRLARASLERALDLFERLGAPLWAERVRADLSRLGLRTAPRDLTPTEERVAALAASGLTARAIAAQLFLSPKTVQANLARAYEKLGVRSRAELGALMAQRR